MEMFTSQPWYAIAGEIIMFANVVTMAIPNAWSAKIPGFKYVVMGLDWLALNVFANKNKGA